MRRWPGCGWGATVIFDTDIFIWIQRGHTSAARLVSDAEERLLSIQTYMELLQGARNITQQDHTKSFIKDFDFRTLPLTENIGHRAAVYIEEHALPHGLRVGDAIIAATAAEHNLVLCTSNVKHFQPIRELKLKKFMP